MTESVAVEHADVLVVGAGPAGIVAAAQLAAGGRRVIVADRARLGGIKPCGELITPRGLHALGRAGFTRDDATPIHPISHVRLTTRDHTTSTRWPSHPLFGQRAAVAPREQLQERLDRAAIDAGATILRAHDATAPIVERGFVRGAHINRLDGPPVDVRADYTIVADGADSRFGRALGTYRQPNWPSAQAHRAIYPSPLHDAAEVELVLDLTDRAGTPITGYGWMFPRGDGTVNVGVLIFSTSPSFQVINPANLLEQFVDHNAKRWHLAPEPLFPAAGGRIPLGGSVGPAAGPTYLVVGDAAGVANPLSGAGIEYAVESAMLAGEVIEAALVSGSSADLQRYPQLLDDRFGTFYKTGRLADRLLGRPSVSTRVARLAASRPAVAESLVRISSNQLRPGRGGTTEFAVRVAGLLSTFAPDS